jgi:hypothetical protein
MVSVSPYETLCGIHISGAKKVAIDDSMQYVWFRAIQPCCSLKEIRSYAALCPTLRHLYCCGLAAFADSGLRPAPEKGAKRQCIRQRAEIVLAAETEWRFSPQQARG